MRRAKQEAESEAAGRLERAERAGEILNDQTERVETQVSLVSTLREGWKRVHERNNLAALFRDDLGRSR